MSAPLEQSAHATAARGPGPTQAKKRRWKHARRRVRNRIAHLFAPAFLRVYLGSIRYRWCGPGLACPSQRGERNCIHVLWHQRVLAFTFTHRERGIHTLVSRHADGDLIAGILERLGFVPVRGSSTRGGPRALRELLACGEEGYDYAIMPDGPRGPCYDFKPGALFLASRTGLPIVPITISFARDWRARSWDRFVIPRPFTRAVIQVGEEIHVPADLRDEELAAWQRDVGERLEAITRETDERFEELYRSAEKLRLAPFRDPCIAKERDRREGAPAH